MSALLAILLSAGGEPGGGGVSLANLTVEAEQPEPVALAVYSLTSTGKRQATGIDEANWITPAMGMANYEVRATLLSGSVSSGSTGSWLSLGTTRSWTRDRASNGSASCGLLIEIRRTSDLSVVASASITLTATVSPL